MIQYDIGERDILLNRLTRLIDFEVGSPCDPSTIPYTYVAMFGRQAQIAIYILVSIVLWDGSRDINFIQSLHRDFRELFKLIHFIPLVRVPLYINTIPETAKWRLEIGK